MAKDDSVFINVPTISMYIFPRDTEAYDVHHNQKLNLLNF